MTVVEDMFIVTHVPGLLVFSIPADDYFLRFCFYLILYFSFPSKWFCEPNLAWYCTQPYPFNEPQWAAFSALVAEFSSYDSCLSGP